MTSAPAEAARPRSEPSEGVTVQVSVSPARAAVRGIASESAALVTYRTTRVPDVQR